MTLLYQNPIHGQSRAEREEQDEGEIEQKTLRAENDFERTEVGDFRGRSGDHEGRRGAEAHPFVQPSGDQRDRSAAAGIERHPDRCRHEHAPGLVPAEDTRHEFPGHIPLKHSRDASALM